MPARLNDGTEIVMPLRNLLSIVAGVALGVWAYFGIVERLNTIETSLIMMEQEVELNSEFRVRWPRGELGSLPADAEQFMLLGHLETELDKLIEEVESGGAPVDRQQQLTLEWYAERIQQLEAQVEYLRGNGR
jgi:hypothetical protein|tara:strand:+ start:19392 stop:19790 length:399 start_codon:yes stop_codon:yes gene_type:complete